MIQFLILFDSKGYGISWKFVWSPFFFLCNLFIMTSHSVLKFGETRTQYVSGYYHMDNIIYMSTTYLPTFSQFLSWLFHVASSYWVNGTYIHYYRSCPLSIMHFHQNWNEWIGPHQNHHTFIEYIEPWLLMNHFHHRSTTIPPHYAT